MLNSIGRMKRESTTVAIASGKGGVGKSVAAVNLAETLLAQGHRTALVDVDFGQGACAVLLNEAPRADALALARHAATPDEVLHEAASGLTLVQGVAEADGARGWEDALYAALDDLLGRLRRDHAFILLDAPAGTGTAVRWAFDRADLGALVLAGEPTAIADAYRLAKLVWHEAPAYPMGALVNFADDEEDARSVADRFGEVTERFTGQAPDYLGWIPFSLGRPPVRPRAAPRRPRPRSGPRRLRGDGPRPRPRTSPGPGGGELLNAISCYAPDLHLPQRPRRDVHPAPPALELRADRAGFHRGGGRRARHLRRADGRPRARPLHRRASAA